MPVDKKDLKESKKSRSIYDREWQLVIAANPEPVTFTCNTVLGIRLLWSALVKRKYEEQTKTGRNLGKLHKLHYEETKLMTVWLSPADITKRIN